MGLGGVGCADLYHTDLSGRSATRLVVDWLSDDDRGKWTVLSHAVRRLCHHAVHSGLFLSLGNSGRSHGESSRILHHLYFGTDGAGAVSRIDDSTDPRADRLLCGTEIGEPSRPRDVCDVWP